MARTFALLDHKCPPLERMLEEKRVSYEWFACGCSPCERQYQVLEDGEWKDIDECPFCKASMAGRIVIEGPVMGPYSSLTGDIVITKKEVECPKCGHKFEV